MTFGVGQRKERKLCPKPLRALRIPRRVVLRSGSTSHGETALRLPPSLEECVALLVARTTCNEGVPAHKEFLRARQTPVPLICIVCWVVACTAPGTRYFCRLRFLFFLLSASGGWVKIKLELPRLLARMYQIHVFRFNPRSRCNSSSRCWYRAIKLELPHLLPRMYQMHVVFRFNPRSRCNSSSRCWYRAREHVDPA